MPTIALLAYPEPSLITTAIHLKANAICSLYDEPSILRKFIMGEVMGNSLPAMSPSVQQSYPMVAPFILERLTPQQKKILACLCLGTDRHTIAKICKLTYHGISFHIKNINTLFGVTTSSQMIAKAYQLGIAQLLITQYKKEISGK